MELIPAIDIRAGRCVRLQEGNPKRQMEYGVSPLQMAIQFYQAGAQKIHVVDLDGALRGETANEKVIAQIVTAVPLGIELGGGIRSLARMAFWLERGVRQVILGTAAVKHPELIDQAIRKFGADRIIVAIDAKNGMVATHGWRAISAISVIDFGRKMVAIGVKRFIYTDIQTDGMFTGPNIAELSQFAKSVTGRITASGGIRNLEDLLSLRALEQDGVDSVIVGRAIYEQRFEVAAAIKALTQGENHAD